MKRKWVYFFAFVFVFALYGISQYRESEGRKQETARPRHRNVYFITASGLRPDHLSSYLYPHIQTPAIDFLAYDGVRFTNAFTNSPSSLIAHLSMLSGLHPHRKPIQMTTELLLEKRNSILPPEMGTLPSFLSQAGYRTAAFLSDPELRFASFFMQFFQEVATGDVPTPSWQSTYSGPDLVRLARQWVIRNQGRPQFLWLNFPEPTYPYEPPGPYNLQYANHPYDGEVAALDEQLGLLIAFLKDLNLFQNSITILAAPYGESLRSTGRFHFPSEETLRVPLLIAAPGLLERRQEYQEKASVVDIASTVRSLMGYEVDPESDGVNLFPKPGEAIERDALFGLNPYPRLFGRPQEILIQTAHYFFFSGGDDADKLQPFGNLKLSEQQQKEWTEEARDYLRMQSLLPEGRTRGREGTEAVSLLENALRLARSNHPAWALDFLQLFQQEWEVTPYLAGLFAELRNESGVPEAGLEGLRAACEKTGNPFLMNLLSQTLLLAGESEDALRAIQASMKSLPRISYYEYYIMGASLLAMHRYTDAVAAFDAALHLNPRLSQTYTLRGTAFEGEKRPERAELDFRKAIELNPQEAPAYRHLAGLLAKREPGGQAIPYMKKFLAFHPNDYSAILDLAILHSESGNWQEARRLLQDVILHSNDPALIVRAEEINSQPTAGNAP